MGGKGGKMHKQMLALGIDAISSVSQLMTNSMEKREEQEESSNGVSKSRQKGKGGMCERRGTRDRHAERQTDRRDGCFHD